MPHDPLHTLMRLRQAALDDARRTVGEALEFEQAAQAACTAAEMAILTETRIATQSDADADVERFACWLKRGRARLRGAELALAEAASGTAHARAKLNLARSAAEATAKALERRSQDAQQQQARAAQREMDEMGARSRS